MSIQVQMEIDAFKRQLLEGRLAQLSEKQRALFHKAYPAPIASHKLELAIDLCDRTIRRNIADPSRLEQP